MNDETKYLILMPSIVKCFQNQCKTVQSHSSKSVVEADLPDIFSRYPYIYTFFTIIVVLLYLMS